MQQCFNQLGPVDVVINCAAISSPAACEKEVATARSVLLVLLWRILIMGIDILILRGIMLGHSGCLELWIIRLQLQTSTQESWYSADMLALQCTGIGLVGPMPATF